MGMAPSPEKVAPGSLQNIRTGGHFFCYFGPWSIMAYGTASQLVQLAVSRTNSCCYMFIILYKFYMTPPTEHERNYMTPPFVQLKIT